jgi:serine/threonine protein kinase
MIRGFSSGKKGVMLREAEAELEEMERSASAHVREELVARLLQEGDVAALQAVDDVPVDVPLQEVDDEFYVPSSSSATGSVNTSDEVSSNFNIGGGMTTTSSLRVLIEEEEPRVLHWQKGNYLGSGSFGDAFLALNLENGEHYVVKQIRLEGESPGNIPDVMALQEEISFLQTLSHPNIVRYICSTIEGDTLNIFQAHSPLPSFHCPLDHSHDCVVL